MIKHATVREEVRCSAQALIENILIDVADYVCSSCPAYRYERDINCWECAFGCDFGDGSNVCMNYRIAQSIDELEEHIVDYVNEALDEMY